MKSHPYFLNFCVKLLIFVTKSSTLCALLGNRALLSCSEEHRKSADNVVIVRCPALFVFCETYMSFRERLVCLFL